MVQYTLPGGMQALDCGIGRLTGPTYYYAREARDTPDDRSGSMASFRRTQSQNLFLEGRVCFVIRAIPILVFTRWIEF